MTPIKRGASSALAALVFLFLVLLLLGAFQ
jgi:hypothetical protein